MKHTKFIAIAVLAGMMALFTGCNKQSTSPATPASPGSPNNGAASFSCTINGVAWVGANVSSTTITKFYAPQYALDGKRLDVRATNSAGEMIILTLIDYRDGTNNDDSFRTGNHFFNVEENPIAGTNMGEDVKGGSWFFQFSSSFATIRSTTGEDNSVGSSVNITSIDVPNKKVSGTFSGTLENMDGVQFTITNGTFSNMPYAVM